MKTGHKHAHGFTLLEVLITVVILAFGLLGLANLQAKLHMSEMEAYQRAQAVVLMQDMVSRLQANGTNAASYITDVNGNGSDPGDWLGAGTTVVCSPAPCTGANADRADWDRHLDGASETKAGANIGAMIGARGCVVQLQARNPATGVCQPGIYEVRMAWQGLYETTAPAIPCGNGQYGNEALRRVIATTVTIGTPECQ